MLGALGVVFGDIGTSPLYALHTAFSMEHNAVSVAPENVYGIISMVLWTITLIVTVKYVLLVTRADNHGQGGILALLALLQGHLRGRRVLAVVSVLALLGAALFYGDSVITPAISVLSAVEGLTVAAPGWSHLVVPLAAVLLTVLFVVQPIGTARVGRMLGPVMLVWFATLAVLGIPQIITHPMILVSLSPHWAIELLIRQPVAAFVLLGAVVLTVTGAEALYADLGHFGARAVRRAWLWVAMPALVLVYLGQGALVISRPETVDNPMVHLAPSALQIPFVILATAATVIASQAVITGAFSMTHQAIRMGLLPRLSVRHTSREEGQIYLPAVNWILFAGVLALVIGFGSSERLASAYGLAVTGTLVLGSLCFGLFARTVWQWAWWKLAAYAVLILALEVALLAANTTKIHDGGWLPLVVAAVLMVLMTTWQRGSAETAAERRAMEGPLLPFIKGLTDQKLRRIPGVAVFPHPRRHTTPLALKQCVDTFGLLPEHVVIVRLVQVGVPHVLRSERIAVNPVGSSTDGIVQVTIRVGFRDRQDIPHDLALAVDKSEELDLDLAEARYFLSVLTLRTRRARSLRDLRRHLYLAMERNQAPRTEVFHLPPTRTIVLGKELHLGEATASKG